MRHITREHHVGARALFVVDDVFDRQFVQMVYYFVRHLPCTLSDYDTPQTQHILHWKYEFALHALPANPLIRELMATMVAVAHDLYAPHHFHLKRMHCNTHLYGDLQSPHTDLTPGITAVYCANPRWESDWMGETLFYNDAGEPVYAVMPKPGRLMVFDADIVHRAGVPSRQCFEPRITVALKFLAES